MVTAELGIFKSLQVSQLVTDREIEEAQILELFKLCLPAWKWGYNL